jgi:hypothetical protein
MILPCSWIIACLWIMTFYNVGFGDEGSWHIYAFFFFFLKVIMHKNDYNYVEDKLHMKSKVSIVLDELMIIYAHLLFLQMWCAIVLYCLILIFNLVVMNLTSHGFFQKGFTFQKTKHFVVSYFNFYHHIWFLLHTFLATWWKDC